MTDQLEDQPPVPGGTTAIRGGQYITEERTPGPYYDRSKFISRIVDEIYDGLLLLEPRAEFDHCLRGVAVRYHDRFALYSKRCVLNVLARDMSDEEEPSLAALEHFEFNIVGGWVGETTPAFIEDEHG